MKIDDLQAFRGSLAADAPIDRALRLAAQANSVSWAFAGAYVNALCQQFDAEPGRLSALCVTEDGGNSAKHIETTFADGRLRGVKSFVTFGEDADDLYVLASRGERDGTKDLVIARVAREHATLDEVIETPFMPEIRHARMSFDTPAELAFENAWPLVKGFRFVEDVFVLGAICQYLGTKLQHRELLALAHGARSLADAAPDDPHAHIAYDGLMRLARREIADIDWTSAPADVAAGWSRDCVILTFAEKARQARLALAESQLA